MAATQTRTSTSAMTRTRVLAVMGKVHEDLMAFSTRGMLDWRSADKWRDDLVFMMVHNALLRFEFQISEPGETSRTKGIRYTIHDSGTWFTDDASGGLDLYGFPDSARANVVITKRSNLEPWLIEAIRGRGFRYPAQALAGLGRQDKTYFNEGYGVVRELFGRW